MALSELFIELVLSFEDADDLEQWAIEYGHHHESIVIQHIQNLRSRNQNQSDVLEDAMVHTSQVSNSIRKFKINLLFI